MAVAADFCIFSSDDSDDAVSDARAYIARNGFTKEDVKLVQRDEQTLVITIREIWCD